MSAQWNVVEENGRKRQKRERPDRPIESVNSVDSVNLLYHAVDDEYVAR